MNATSHEEYVVLREYSNQTSHSSRYRRGFIVERKDGIFMGEASVIIQNGSCRLFTNGIVSSPQTYSSFEEARDRLEQLAIRIAQVHPLGRGKEIIQR